MLVAATGAGWAAFKLPEDRSGDPLQWPWVTLTIDQGSDGWSAAFFMMSIGVNILLLNDASHRVWNDFQLACQDTSLLVGTLQIGPLTN